MRRVISYLIFALPFFVLSLWVYRLLHTVTHGDSIVLKVAAYDPRDLLAGHYLQYTINFAPDGFTPTEDTSFRPCDVKSEAPERCICLKRGSGMEPASVQWMGACAEELLANCKTYLKGQCDNSRFETGLERFYFPDEYSTKLQRAPEGSTILVKLDGNGGGLVTDFFVNGVPLLEYVRKLP